MPERIVRIAGASACEFDTSIAVPQLLERGGPIDYLVFDELAELNVATMAGAGRSVVGLDNQEAGFATSFVDIQVGPHLPEIMARGIKLVANAGGPNPRGCAAHLAEHARSLGLSPSIAYVEGDNVLDRLDEFAALDPRELATGEGLGELADSADRVLTLLAYTGALPVAEALARGADIVITGRAADSAAALGALMHEFGWSMEDFDRLAAGSIIGHLIECGPQVTGGIHTDWRDVPDWSCPSYPIAECRADGTAIITLPQDTGGIVTVGTVAEQLLYEVSDPGAYILPDVVCDLSEVRLTEVAPDRVLIEGVRGRPRTSTYKLQMTYERGWRATVMSPILGSEAAAKGDRLAASMFTHINGLLEREGLGAGEASVTQILGTEESLGAHVDPGQRRDAREVVVRMVLDHADRAGAELFLREQAMANIAQAPGVVMPMGHSVSPILRMRSFLVDKALVELAVVIDDERIAVDVPVTGAGSADREEEREEPALPAGLALDASVPLVALAWGRSGDKGNTVTVGIIARARDYVPYIAAALSAEAVADWMAHTFDDGLPGRVDRRYVPGIGAFGFLLHAALGGGALESQRLDPMGKSYAQQLLAMPVPVTAAIARLIDDDRDGSQPVPAPHPIAAP